MKKRETAGTGTKTAERKEQNSVELESVADSGAIAASASQAVVQAEPSRNETPQDYGDTPLTLAEFLIALGRGAAMGGVIALVGRIVGADPFVTDIFGIFVTTTLTTFLLGRKYFSTILLYGLAITCLILAVLLAWAQYSVRSDPWQVWKSRLDAAVAECKNNDDVCLAKAVSSVETFDSRTKGAPGLMSDRVADDLRAGTEMLTHPEVSDMLNRRIGIKQHFLGTGLALPQGGKAYADARVPEYLVKNHRQDHENALAWKFEPRRDYLDQIKVEDLLRRDDIHVVGTTPQTAATLKQKRASLLAHIENALRNPSSIPPVIRFQQFAGQPSGFFGRDTAKRTFFLDLKSVWNLRLGEAARLSGHVDDTRQGDEALYIWIFLPVEADESVPATWSEIIPKLGGWMEAG